MCLLLAKRKGCRANVGCSLRYPFQQIGYILAVVEFGCQCDDVTALAGTEVIPLVEFGIYLNEASVSFLSGDLYHRLLPCCLTGV